MIRQAVLARVPQGAEAGLSVLPFDRLVQVYMNWLGRLVPPRPRTVHLAKGLFTDVDDPAVRGAFARLVDKIREGEDLRPHLSRDVRFAYPSDPSPLPAGEPLWRGPSQSPFGGRDEAGAARDRTWTGCSPSGASTTCTPACRPTRTGPSPVATWWGLPLSAVQAANRLQHALWRLDAELSRPDPARLLGDDAVRLAGAEPRWEAVRDGPLWQVREGRTGVPVLSCAFTL